MSEAIVGPVPAEMKQLAIAPVDKTALAEEAKQWESCLQAYADVPCESADECEWWIAQRDASHERVKALTEEPKELCAPLEREAETIRAPFRDTRKAAEAFKALANGKVNAYTLACDRKAVEARQLAAAASAAGDDDATIDALASIPDKWKFAGNSTRIIWDVESFDVEVMSTSSLARSHLTLNEKSIAQVLKIANESNQTHPPCVPGVKFTKVAMSKPTGRKSK
ncbi:MAG: hypothetical protein RLZZ450_104 [Pseudomonadota bacterium]|jgi:hypothetical protein